MRLTAARAAVDAGDRAAALVEVTAALEIDPDFLAAHALRDRILAPQADVAQAAPSAPVSSSTSGLPDGYAMFEQRAKRRRVDRRIAVAGAAIARRHLHAAADALDEVIEIDPHLPELADLTARFDDLRRAAAMPRRGPWIAAAAVFAGGLFGGSWLQDSSPILARQTIAAAPLLIAVAPLPALLAAPLTPTVTVAARVDPVGTTRERGRNAAPPAPLDAAPRTLDAHNAPPPTELRLPAVPIDNPSPAPVALAVHTSPVAPVALAVHTVAETPALVPAPTPVPPTVDSVDDNLLVKQALQRYRTAYEGLDARSAQAVWPAVNQAALARAFDGLASQTLTFDACDVRLHGEAATATCHGSARYVTKVGSRDPRVEPRVWNFTLRRAGSDWQIDSALAGR